MQTIERGSLREEIESYSRCTIEVAEVSSS